MQVSPKVGVWLDQLDLQDRTGGQGFRTTDLSGWWEPAGTTGEQVQRSNAPGAWLSEAHPTGRRLVLKGGIQSPTHRESVARLDALTAAIPGDEPRPLAVLEDGSLQHLLVRQEDIPIYKWLSDTYVTYDVQLQSGMHFRRAGDGTRWSHSITVGLPLSQGGRQYPYRLPSAFSATVTSGTVQLPPAGSAPPAVELAFAGPVLNPAVRTSDGQVMVFALEVLAGQTLVVNLQDETVMLNGVPRRGTLQGSWLQLPKAGTTLIFDAATYTAAARMTVSWSEQWK